jgi:serine/threonine protein kinase
MTTSSELEARLARVIEYHVEHGTLPPMDAIAADRPELAAPLLALAERYLRLSAALDTGLGDRDAGPPAPPAPADLAIDGFRTIERLGSGGMGEVYKLQDLKLDRVVAAKVLRRDREAGVSASFTDFLREARSLALFSDPRIVQIFEFRADADPPVLIMEYVDGFELGRLGPSLEFRQRAKVLRDVCDAIDRAHRLGIQHRDLKPSNIMLDGRLAPKILDFGLSGGDPRQGHLRGTLWYIAPEQLDASQPIDARTDVYALGVILYELLCGVVPYTGDTDSDVVDAVRRGSPRLPIEIDPRVPEGLQAIALKAMERRPADRYPSAREMAHDFDRYLEGRPVTTRPSQYASTLAARVRPHLDQIGEWLRLKLIYPHEATRLHAAYRQLEAREDDWIVASRALSYSQIALYLGAFFLFAGGVYFFVARRVFHEGTGPFLPFVVLGVPFLGLNAAGRWLYRRDHQAVAVAFYLAGVSLLPLFLLVALYERHLFVAAAGAPGELFPADTVSNRQLQVTVFMAWAWASWLAVRTKTGALSTVATLLGFLLAIALLADSGLREWIDHRQFDLLALHLAPIVLVYVVVGYALERQGRPWFARPIYMAAGLSLLAVLDLLALDGRMFHYLGGLSMQPLQPEGLDNPLLIDTLAALTLNGAVFYLAASAVERRGSLVMAPAAQLLFTVAPFSILEPMAVLSRTQNYSTKFDWMYLALAVTIAVLSHQRQRKSFYYAGLVNTGFALYLIALRQHWFDKPSWAVALVTVGLVTLAAGFALDALRRRSS